MYLINNFSPLYLKNVESSVDITRISKAVATDYLSDGFKSGVTRMDFALLLADELGMRVYPDRKKVSLEPGDVAVAAMYSGRRVDNFVEDEVEGVIHYFLIEVFES